MVSQLGILPWPLGFLSAPKGMEWAVGFRWEKLAHGERSFFLQWRGFSTSLR
jgi:hypothetical protein